MLSVFNADCDSLDVIKLLYSPSGTSSNALTKIINKKPESTLTMSKTSRMKEHTNDSGNSGSCRKKKCGGVRRQYGDADQPLNKRHEVSSSSMTTTTTMKYNVTKVRGKSKYINTKKMY